jgi:polyribonucleotide nucleotidyltransferase
VKKITKNINWNNSTISIETGVIAKQATTSLIVRMEDTVLLITVVGENNNNVSEKDFFPLRVDYIEKSYAAGKIPRSFFKREGRPSEREILVSRLIDRSIRPIFPKDYFNEVQVIVNVLSLDPKVDPDVLAIIGASCALYISPIPFNLAIAGVRVSCKDNELYCSNAKQEDSDLDLVISGTSKSIFMVESASNELTEEKMIEAITFAKNQMEPILQTIQEMNEEINHGSWTYHKKEQDNNVLEEIKSKFENKFVEAYKILDKTERVENLKQLKKEINELYPEEKDKESININDMISIIEKNIVRNNIIEHDTRIDGRDSTTVRNISIEKNFLPRTHGSALFTRGETQAIVVITLGDSRDAQIIDGIMEETKDNLIVHYNFLPFCVGEIGLIGHTKRREIGHGNLVKKGIRSLIPSKKDFPYVVRVVSEITESNGSSSMASVCGASLALMDAGVKIKKPVAGIAMGLIKTENNYKVLTDIMGTEDHLGDMDFKVVGTEQGITALQMDIKIDGIDDEIINTALKQARDGRLHILNEMSKSINTSEKNVSQFAPFLFSMKINPEKIKDIIGKGGITIRNITEETGANIDIQNDGNIMISASNQEIGNKVKEKIDSITQDIIIGKIYTGKIVRIVNFGAFINILPGKDGLVHISQIRQNRVNNINDLLKVGDIVKAKVIEIDKQHRIRLSIKDAVEV